jgi:glycosyltransferase involved in cell wall biosynthesis
VLTHNEQGLLVPPRNVDSLAEALLTLLNDSSLRERMGEKGVLHARKYSWENVSRQIMDYYIELLN